MPPSSSAVRVEVPALSRAASVLWTLDTAGRIQSITGSGLPAMREALACQLPIGERTAWDYTRGGGRQCFAQLLARARLGIASECSETLNGWQMVHSAAPVHGVEGRVTGMTGATWIQRESEVEKPRPNVWRLTDSAYGMDCGTELVEWPDGVHAVTRSSLRLLDRLRREGRVVPVESHQPLTRPHLVP